MSAARGLSRRIFLAGAAAASALSGTRAAFAADRVRVGKAITSSFPFAGLELAQQQGLWASEGIEAEISAFAGDGRLQQALAAGALDFGFGGGPGMGYATKGVPARAIAAIAYEPRNMSIVVTDNSPVKKIGDLKGMKIGVTTAGSLTDWLARRLAESQGWGADGVQVVPLGDMRSRLAAMRAGDLQASVNSIEESLQLQDQGGGKMLTTFGDAIPDFLTHVIFASDAVIQKNPDLVRRFLRAWYKTAAFMRDHRVETVKSIAQTMSITEKVVDESYDDELKMLSFDGSFPPKALETIRASLLQLGITDTEPALKAMYDPQFVPVKL
ncbi:MAG TPA: ABC transporter substrate-binding protein [Beijerinckiaceae bacterium]|nr:ABC transporter substrate-binding protein [Beijerinckiaceae bacterium]